MNPTIQLNTRNGLFDVIYLTPEILFSDTLHTGAGGLGVVAGSFMYELEHNFKKHNLHGLAISMYPSHGYQHQVVRPLNGGVMDVTYRPQIDTETEDTGVRLSLRLCRKNCAVAVRKVTQASVHTNILLLSTDIPENPEEFRMISRVLYGEGHATQFFSRNNKPWHNIDHLRVLQAAVLGLGTKALLEHLQLQYRILHLNESHPVFFLISQFGVFRKEFDGNAQIALQKVQQQSVFTNHTILGSGNKHYSIPEILHIAGEHDGFDYETLLSFGQPEGGVFSMTHAAMHLVGKGHINAVSQLHSTIANEKWPGYDIIGVTNGISSDYQHPLFQKLTRWERIPQAKQEIKHDLHNSLIRRAKETGTEIKATVESLQESVLITWARRCQEYKRPDLMWHNNELSLVKQLLKWGHISVAWGGKVHPDDTQMMNDWNKYWRRFRDLPNTYPVFNYRLDLMRSLLKAGSDIWLNTPQFGHEACGTSVMSAMQNYTAVVTILDGCMQEVSPETIYGFGSTEDGNWHIQYRDDARSLWQTALPLILKLREHDPNTYARLIEAGHEASMRFSSERMVSDYKQFLYKKIHRDI